MRSRRIAHDRVRGRAANADGGALSRLWTSAKRRPVDSFAILAVIAASAIIVVNAMFLQSGMIAAPFFANPKSSQIASGDPQQRLQPANAATPVPPAVAPQPAPARRDDPIADLISPSPRVAAVQRALSDYGYGQIRPNGMLDDNTAAAIEKFEREHKLPVTGQISDRLVSELGTMVGHPL